MTAEFKTTLEINVQHKCNFERCEDCIFIAKGTSRIPGKYGFYHCEVDPKFRLCRDINDCPMGVTSEDFFEPDPQIVKMYTGVM